ncbi:MAG TPA: SemiSWEET transporter [Gammaproteobacteria bacterium]|nr:SemiSWEET transporter [Gammaproteobacteria bacterium]
MFDTLEILGLTAGACTTFSVIPQIQKIIASKSAKDISYIMYFTNCTGFVLWITYGALKGSMSLVAANAITLLLQGTVIILKYHWERK